MPAVIGEFSRWKGVKATLQCVVISKASILADLFVLLEISSSSLDSGAIELKHSSDLKKFDIFWYSDSSSDELFSSRVVTRSLKEFSFAF